MYSIMVVCGTVEELDRMKWIGKQPDDWYLWDDGDGDGPKESMVVQAELRLFGRRGKSCFAILPYILGVEE